MRSRCTQPDVAITMAPLRHWLPTILAITFQSVPLLQLDARLYGFEPVGAENTVTSRDLRIFVDQAAKPVTSPDAEVVVGRRDVSPAGRWFLAEGPVRPAGVVVIDVFAEDMVQVPSAPGRAW
jgi:hypothetical protein